MTELANPDAWERLHHEPTEADALLFFVVYGDIDFDLPVSRSRYHFAGIPEGIEVMRYSRDRHGDYLAGFEAGHAWDELVAADPGLADRVRAARTCVIMHGAVRDPGSLDYLRDTLGFLAYCLDHGGVAIYDLQTFTWWRPEEWRTRIFEPGAGNLAGQVVILESPESADTTWLHTRGLRKFARPDLSVRGVGAGHRDGVVDMLQRFIGLQAQGGVIPDGQEIRMANLPAGGSAHHGGHLDDPDFNNVHVEFSWPEPGLR